MSAASTALAEEDAKKDPKKMNGKELFRAECKVCHAEDSDWGEYSPMELIIEQWEEFFDGGVYEKTHKEVLSTTDAEKTVLETIDEDMLKKIRKFCIDGAADSEQPMTCG
jgi:hypothetical protein